MKIYPTKHRVYKKKTTGLFTYKKSLKKDVFIKRKSEDVNKKRQKHDDIVENKSFLTKLR